MLKPNTNQHLRMTKAEREQFANALAEELAAKAENVEFAKEAAALVRARCEFSVDVVRQLREAREAAGVSLADLELATGIRKSVLSRLENSQAPNPTLSTLQRYAEAVGVSLEISIRPPST